jgi:bifunctional non-homologous end joining protein LigD
MSRAFPEVIEAMRTLPDVVLDGELIVSDGVGGADFRELQRRSRMRRLPIIEEAAARRPASLVIFDVLQVGGVDLRALPLLERKACLRATVSGRTGLRLTDGLETHGEALFAAICDGDLEGIVGKRLDSRYLAGRQPSWLKFKNPTYSRKASSS